MATPFRSTVQGVEVSFEPEELRILSTMVDELAMMLAPSDADSTLGLGLLGAAAISADPVLARLLPDAYDSDPEAAREFRRLTEIGLRTHKAQALSAMRASLLGADATLCLDRSEAAHWLAGLNDLRLAIGTRLGEHRGDSTAIEVARNLYDWLTWLQDTLITALHNGADTVTS